MRDVAKLWTPDMRWRFAGETLSSPKIVCSTRRAAVSGTNSFRHKMLDAVGDLALAGAPLLGATAPCMAGHKLTMRHFRPLMADHSAWTLTKASRCGRCAVMRICPRAGRSAFAPDLS